MGLIYQKKLDGLQRLMIGIGAFKEYHEIPIDERYALIAAKMQEEYPGNYTVEEFVDSVGFTLKLRLKFFTEEEEAWFKLKWH